MPRCRNRAHAKKEMDGTAMGRVVSSCSWTEDKENGGHFGTEAKAVPRVERTGAAEREMVTEEVAAEFCLVFAEKALQLVSRRPRKKVDSILRLVSVANFDAGALRQDVKGINDCKQLKNNSER